MFATLLMEEARTQARRNAGVVGIIAAVASGAVFASLLRIPWLSSVSAGSPDWCCDRRHATHSSRTPCAAGV